MYEFSGVVSLKVSQGTNLKDNKLLKEIGSLQGKSYGRYKKACRDHNIPADFYLKIISIIYNYWSVGWYSPHIAFEITGSDM